MATEQVDAQEKVQAVVEKINETIEQQEEQQLEQQESIPQTGEEQSTKRKFESEEDGPQAKRHSMNNSSPYANMSTLPEESPQGAQYELMDTIDCPANLVGKLIGRRGETIQILENKTNTKLQVDHKGEGDPKPVTIKANEQKDIDAARELINNVLYSELNVTDCKEELECPQEKVGRIIGKAGETIRNLQKFSGAKVQVIQDYPEGQPRVVTITGKLDAVDRAAKMVQDLIDDESLKVQQVIQKHINGITRTIQCPKAMVGKVIGQRGETIRKLQSDIGVVIKINQDNDPCEVLITGSKDNVAIAEEQLRELINPQQRYPGQPGQYPNGPGRGSAPPGKFQMGRGQYGQYGHAGGSYPQQYGVYGQPGYGTQGGYPYGGGAQGYGQTGYGQGGYPSYGGQEQSYGSQYGGYAQQSGQVPVQQDGAGWAQGGGGGQWQEVKDDTSGRYYYYHTQSGVCQWERPADFTG